MRIKIGFASDIRKSRKEVSKKIMKTIKNTPRKSVVQVQFPGLRYPFALMPFWKIFKSNRKQKKIQKNSKIYYHFFL